MENYLKFIAIAVLPQLIKRLFLYALMSIMRMINLVEKLGSGKEACFTRFSIISIKTGLHLGYIYAKCSL